MNQVNKSTNNRMKVTLSMRKEFNYSKGFLKYQTLYQSRMKLFSPKLSF